VENNRAAAIVTAARQRLRDTMIFMATNHLMMRVAGKSRK
jgi:hypothetical protein